MTHARFTQIICDFLSYFSRRYEPVSHQSHAVPLLNKLLEAHLTEHPRRVAPFFFEFFFAHCFGKSPAVIRPAHEAAGLLYMLIEADETEASEVDASPISWQAELHLLAAIREDRDLIQSVLEAFDLVEYAPRPDYMDDDDFCEEDYDLRPADPILGTPIGFATIRQGYNFSKHWFVSLQHYGADDLFKGKYVEDYGAAKELLSEWLLEPTTTFPNKASSALEPHAAQPQIGAINE